MSVSIAILVSYLIGAVPTAYVVARQRKGIDIRKVGSRNMGAMNVLYNVGVAEGILVLAVDFAKGLLAVFIARWLGESLNIQMLCGAIAILGHMYPVFLKFKGVVPYVVFRPLQMLANRGFDTRDILCLHTLIDIPVTFDCSQSCLGKVHSLDPVSEHVTPQQVAEFHKPGASARTDEDFVEFGIAGYNPGVISFTNIPFRLNNIFLQCHLAGLQTFLLSLKLDDLSFQVIDL